MSTLVIDIHAFLLHVMQAVPCLFKEKLNSICGNWLVAKCQGDLFFDFFLEKIEIRTNLVGPYVRSLMRVYDLNIGDVLSFDYIWEDEDYVYDKEQEFDLTVYQIGENGREAKPRVANPGKTSCELAKLVKC